MYVCVDGERKRENAKAAMVKCEYNSRRTRVKGICEWILWTLLQKNFFKKKYFYFHSFIIALTYQFLLTNVYIIILPNELYHCSVMFPSQNPLVFFGARYEPVHWLGSLNLDHSMYVFLPGIKHLFSYLKFVLHILVNSYSFLHISPKMFSVRIILKQFTFLLPLLEKPLLSIL